MSRIKKVYRDLKTSDFNWLIPAILGIVWLFYQSISTLMGIITETEVQGFPATTLDWFGLVGGIVLFSLALYGTAGLIKYFVNDDKNQIK